MLLFNHAYSCRRAQNVSVLPEGGPLRAETCISVTVNKVLLTYEGHLESKERFAIKKYLLIIGKKKNMQVLSHTFTYFSI